jgi:hypothetical protein
MHRWFRQPLAWMVAAEVIVVGALVAVAWHEVTAAGQAPAPLILPATSTPDDTSAPNVPADAVSPPEPSSLPLLPGLNVDPAFWRERLAGLNEAEAQFEALEWRIIHSAMDTVRRYVDTVVVPAVERAEMGGGP